MDPVKAELLMLGKMYFIGYFVALTVALVFNRYYRHKYGCWGIELKEALLFGLFSWASLLLAALVVVGHTVTDTKAFEIFRDYFEGRDKEEH